MPRASIPASPRDALHPDCPPSRPAPVARLAVATVAFAALTLGLGCGQKADPQATPETARPASSALSPVVLAPTGAGSKAGEGAAPMATAPRADAPTEGSAKKPATALVEPPRAPIATGAPAPVTPSALASAAPTAVPAVSATPTVEVVTPVPTVESPKTAEASFNLWMQAAGKYKAGQPGVVQVVLVAQGGFHCNDKYPYKFKLGAPPAGVSYPEPVVRLDHMSITPSRSVMTVPFVPSAPGDARLSGTFSFSVCSPSSCQLETRDLAIAVKVE